MKKPTRTAWPSTPPSTSWCKLGKPAQRFLADIGLENNDDTQRGATMGNGSVTFHVLVGGKEVFASPVRRIQDGPLSLDIPLHGAREFEIRVKDGGDGRGWDQALWAEATVLLQDGTNLRLQDLPWAQTVDYNPYGFSFLYGGSPSTSQLSQWTRQLREDTRRTSRLRRELVYRDPATGLEVRVEGSVFTDFPAVEWVVHLKNHRLHQHPSPRVHPSARCRPARHLSDQPVLHWAKGAVASFDDFAPQTTVLKAGRQAPPPTRRRTFLQPGAALLQPRRRRRRRRSPPWAGAANGRRSSPAANAGSVSHQSRHGPHASRPPAGENNPHAPHASCSSTRATAGAARTSCASSSSRTTVPPRNGQPLLAPITCGNWGGTRAEVHLDNIRKIIQHQLPIEYYWIDAEWYGQRRTGRSNVGNWNVKTGPVPAGLQAAQRRAAHSPAAN